MFLQKKFREYYKKANIELPKRFGRREFGFMFFDNEFVQRHISFKAKDDFKKFLIEKVPSHIYYSSAYYEKPEEKMSEKNWLGADLIFDLDADHLKGVKELSYEQQLQKVKEETIKLFKDFLLDDFGFKEENVKVVFSGGRGYHLHVFDERVFQLTSQERREIIDYIQGIGLDFDKIFQKIPINKMDGKYGKIIYARKMPPKDSIGWKKKIGNGIINFIIELESKNEEEIIKILMKHKGVGEKIGKEIYNALFDGEKGKRGIDKIKEEREIDVFKDEKALNLFLEIIKEKVAVEVSGESDEPVTSDTKRLIRLPYSLHGKTGLLVKILEYDELKEFNPLKDAIVFSDFPIKINIKKPIKITMKESFDLKEGITEVPEYLAVFLIARNFAEVVK